MNHSFILEPCWPNVTLFLSFPFQTSFATSSPLSELYMPRHVIGPVHPWHPTLSHSSQEIMRTGGELPVQIHPDHDELKQQHRARYYVRRARDSLTTRVSKIICAIFLTLLFIFGLVAFILWLSLRPHRPRFHVQDFSVPGLGQPNGFENAQVNFNVTARNANQNIGIYYDAMQVNLLYEDQSIGGASLLFPFYQQPKNTTVLFGLLTGATLTVNKERWMQFQGDLGKGMVVFRLDLTSTIRFKVVRWQSKHHKMHANCEVRVGPDGSILASYKGKRCPVYFT
ncbi:hypothetical protein NMG60_11022430 [Bertholletia excelsa]